MADEQDRPAGLGDFAHLAEAFLAEGGVADGEHFVDEQDLRGQVRGYGEAQAHGHAAGVALHGRLQQLLDAGESDDRGEGGADFAALHAQDGAA